MKSDEVSIPPPQRWNAPFDANMTDADVRRIRRIEPFRNMDEAQFPAPITLDGIIRNDMRLRHFDAGEVVVRADDYGNSAFLVVRGEVRVLLGPENAKNAFKRDTPQKNTLAQAIRQLWRTSRFPESRDPARYANPVAEEAREDPLTRVVETIEVFDAWGKHVDTVHLEGMSECWIGRGEDNHVVLPDTSVSRRHAVIRLNDGEAVITDCDSLNGVMVDGAPVRQHRFAPGDEAHIGTHRLRYSKQALLPAGDSSRLVAWPGDNDSAKQFATSVFSAPEYDPHETRIFLRGVDDVLEDQNTAVLREGQIFGEIAALGRTPRTATVVAAGPALLLEMRWQGLRDIRRRDEAFRRHVEEVYRERSLATHLRSTPLFAHLDAHTLQLLVEQTVFETYGEFDWHASYKRFAAVPEAERLEREPLIVEQGGYPDGLLLIRSGFARVAQRYHNGLRTQRYIGQGTMFGLEEILAGWQGNNSVAYTHSLRAVGYADVLRVPTALLEEFVLPTLTTTQIADLLGTGGAAADSRMAAVRSAARADSGALGLPASLVEGLVDHHFINGRAAMLINLDRCVRCDACTEACAAAHDNNPRFNRHGRRLDKLMIANACMHCVDPVCMIGCPTGAIHRASEAGEVIISDETCIGCGTCANSCPYDNIRMVEIRDDRGRFIFDEVSQMPVRKATKCDLCIDQLGGPACERACPYDALRRADMGDLPKLAQWLK